MQLKVSKMPNFPPGLIGQKCSIKNLSLLSCGAVDVFSWLNINQIIWQDINQNTECILLQFEQNLKHQIHATMPLSPSYRLAPELLHGEGQHLLVWPVDLDLCGADHGDRDTLDGRCSFVCWCLQDLPWMCKLSWSQSPGSSRSRSASGLSARMPE